MLLVQNLENREKKNRKELPQISSVKKIYCVYFDEMVRGCLY